MRKKKSIEPSEENLKDLGELFIIHKRLVNLPIVLREDICLECGWSTPTFYRKMRSDARMSNAEMDKIFELANKKLHACLTEFALLAAGGIKKKKKPAK
jgi:hypothetical protein